MPRYIDGEFVLRRKNYEGNDKIKYKGKAPFFTFVVRNRSLLTHKPEKYAPSYRTLTDTSNFLRRFCFVFS